MTVSCTMGRHAPISRSVRNEGLRFSRCRHCDRDVIRLRGGWVTPPRGLRVVWRRVDANGPLNEASRTPRAHHRIEAIAALAGAAIRLVVWTLAARWRAWRERPRPEARREPIRALSAG